MQTEIEANAKAGRSWVKRILIACSSLFLVLIAGLTIFTLIGYWLIHTEPNVWQDRPNLVALSQDIQYERADRLEQRLLDELSRIQNPPADDSLGSAQPLTFTASIDDINLWLEQRLKLWLQNRNIEPPADIQQFMFTFRGKRPSFSVPITYEDQRYIISATFDLSFTDLNRADADSTQSDEGSLLLKLHAIHLGKMRVPINLIHQLAGDRLADLPPDAAAVLDDGLPIHPTLQIDATRIQRILNIKPGRDPETNEPVLVMTYQTEPKPDTR